MAKNDLPAKTTLTELTEILSLPAMINFQKNITDNLATNIAVVDDKEKILSSCSKMNNKLFILFLKKIMAKISLQDITETTYLELGKGLQIPIVPLKFQDMLKGFIIAGPAMPHELSQEEQAPVARKFGFRPDELKKILASNPAQTPERIGMIHSFVQNFADLIILNYSEKINSSRTFQEVAALYKVVKSLNSTLSLKEVLSKVLQYSTDLLEAKNGSVMILDEDTKVLRIFVSYGLDDAEIKRTKIPIGEGIAGRVAKSGVSKLILKEDRKTSQNQEKRESDTESTLCVPLSVQGQIFGVINISGAKENKNFTKKNLDLLEIIASSAAVAINNAKLYEGLCKKVQEHATLLYVGNAISSSLNPDTVLQEVLDKAIRLLDAQKGSLMLIDDETCELRIVNACGLSWEIIEYTRIKLGEGIAGRVAKEGEPLLLRKGIKVTNSHSDKTGEELPSAISVPVKIKDKIIGVLNISDHIKKENFNADHVGILQMFATQAAIAIENSRLHRELKELFVGSVKALINAIEARDPYTKGHSIRVTHYSSKIAQALKMKAEEVENIQYAALLHDIGKINVKDEILLKPGKLSEEERHAIEEHPNYGALIMKPVKAFQRILPFLYYHHEKYAGSGYPTQLKGDKIPVESRIIAVADSFDAMTSDRPYRRALTIEDALKELERNAGTQFDPNIVNVFVELVHRDKTCTPEFATESSLF
jgi:putative nucleotidyltransferase with HDIG domain